MATIKAMIGGVSRRPAPRNARPVVDRRTDRGSGGQTPAPATHVRLLVEAAPIDFMISCDHHVATKAGDRGLPDQLARAPFGRLAMIALTGAWLATWQAAAQPPRVTGAFIQLNGSLATRSASWWQTEIDAMAAVGMDTLVIQYSAVDNTYFYPTTIPGKSPLGVDSLERILDAADQRAMQVYLGLHLDSTQSGPGAFNLASNLAQGQATLEELAARYGGHSSLAGWYSPQELSDYIAFDPSQAQLRNDLVRYVHDMAALGRSAAGLELPTMISPYFGQNPNASAYAQWWNVTGLPGMNVDIVAMQDGVGTHRTTIAQSQTVYAAAAPVMAGHGVEFWANNESFNQIHGWPVDNQSFQAVPTSIETFIDQIESTAPFVAKSITFEFSHYMSPQGSAAAQALYNDYQEHLLNDGGGDGGGGARVIPVAGYTYENSSTAVFHASASDAGRSRLTDGDLGSLSGGPGSAFANGSWAGFGDDGPEGGPQPRVVLDLGGAHEIGALEITYLVDASAYIFAPQSAAPFADAVTVESSVDGVSFAPIASTNDFPAWTADLAADAFERRTVRFELGGATASHLAVDVRTPNTWIFLGEIQVFEFIAAADFDADGVVDGGDLARWQAGFGAAGNSASGDANSDGEVDGADVLVWQQQLAGAAAAVSSTLVAEPSACALGAWLSAALALAPNRRGRRRRPSARLPSLLAAGEEEG